MQSLLTTDANCHCEAVAGNTLRILQSLGEFDFHPALPFWMQLLRISKTSKAFVLSSRLAGKHVRRVIAGFTKNGLNICCAQLGFSK